MKSLPYVEPIIIEPSFEKRLAREVDLNITLRCKARRKKTKVKTTAATSSSRELHRGGQTESSEVEDKSKEENDSADDDSSSEIDSSSDEGSADDDSENGPSPTSTSDSRGDAEAKALKSKKMKRRSPKTKSSISLAAYIVASGDFTDPLTRIPLSMQDLERLDATVKALNEKKTSKKTSNTQRASVVEAFKATSHYKSARCQRDALLGLERYLGEQVAEVLATIEEVNDGELEPNEAEQVILTEILPSFQHNFEILARADALLARQSLSQYLSFVRGPPNRATRNRCGFRDFILAVLQVFESIVQSPHSQHVLSSSQINLLLRTAPTSSTSSSSRANELSTRQI
ncbi:Hypothetical Protein FCC1311_063392 [Hondaea fermentalgiana]|uniref:Uncharacterized protein n=1 Tax=Hondaea fermentalgiana TaxID=2315210 RepID=A0A2R5GIH7_9STRA|nr:Hypothetical Protein FCC1311_063392 [Hondaea fermentalgiana]|eukprot:GBG30119.1 Hypothetical Protein FCC1311_063392 [Hondaea fermentalgiana]